MVWRSILGSLLLLCLGIPVLAQPMAVSDEAIGEPMPAVAFLLSYRQFTTADVSDTYKGLLSYGLRLSWRTAAGSWLLLSALYGKTLGDPYYDTPEFEGFAASELSVLPLQLGFLFSSAPNPRLNIQFGIACEAAWAREKVPALAAGSLDHRQAHSGWIYGLIATLGPEWRSRAGERALGLQIGYGKSGGDIGRGRAKHELSLNAFSAHLYYAIQL